jgi:hypothetical protein
MREAYNGKVVALIKKKEADKIEIIDGKKKRQ